MSTQTDFVNGIRQSVGSAITDSATRLTAYATLDSLPRKPGRSNPYNYDSIHDWFIAVATQMIDKVKEDAFSDKTQAYIDRFTRVYKEFIEDLEKYYNWYNANIKNVIDDEYNGMLCLANALRIKLKFNAADYEIILDYDQLQQLKDGYKLYTTSRVVKFDERIRADTELTMIEFADKDPTIIKKAIEYYRIFVLGSDIKPKDTQAAGRNGRRNATKNKNKTKSNRKPKRRLRASQHRRSKR